MAVTVTVSHGVVTPRVPSTLTYRYRSCPVNGILSKYFIIENAQFYQTINSMNNVYTSKKNEINTLLNEGYRQGRLRNNIAAETTALRDGVAAINNYLANYNKNSLQLMYQRNKDISKIAAGKVSARTLDKIKQRIRLLHVRTHRKIKNRIVLMENLVTIAFFTGDIAKLIYLDDIVVPADLKQALQNSAKVITKLQSDLDKNIQNNEYKLIDIQYKSEQTIVNIVQTLCPRLS